MLSTHFTRAEHGGELRAFKKFYDGFQPRDTWHMTQSHKKHDRRQAPDGYLTPITGERLADGTDRSTGA